MLNTVSSVALVLVLSTLESVTSASTQRSTRMSLNATGYDSTVKPSKAISDIPALPNTIIYHNDDCTLITNSESGIEQLNEYVHNEDVKLIRYIFTIDNTTTPINTTSSKLYRPMLWARTFSAQGLGVLQLGEMYEVYSFRLLDIGVETLEIHLSQKPADCLQGKSADELEQLLRNAILSELQIPSHANDGFFNVYNDSQNICNQHALTDQGILNISYYCCTLDNDNQLVCKYLTFTVWMKIICWLTMILPAIIVLFLPSYLPKSLLVSMSFVTYRLSDENALRVSYIESENQIDKNQKHKVIDMDKIKHMKQFSEIVSKAAVNTTFHLKLLDILLMVPNKCVFTLEDIGLWNVFFKSFGESYTKGYRILTVITKLLLAVLVFTPVLIRVAVFYAFEYDEAIAQEESAKEHSVVVVIQTGLTLNLPPFHPIYITACAINGINTVVYCLVGVFWNELIYTLEYAVKSCLKSMMKDMANRVVCVKNFKNGIKDFLDKSIFLLMLVPILVVLLPPLLIIYLLPLGNLLFRLLMYVISLKVWKETDNITSKERKHEDKDDDSIEMANNVRGYLSRRFIQCLIVIYSVVSIVLLMFLLYDCICFYVDILVYTFIGFIINFNAAASYISVFFLVMFYGKQCYGSVHAKYATFYKALLRYCTKQANSNQQDNLNEALPFKPALVQSKDSRISLDMKVKYPELKITKAPLLMRETNEFCLIKAFYDKACNMPHENAPGYNGKPLLPLVNAMIEFILILIFLTLVLVVVFAFGDDYNLSTTNKTIVAVMGGVVPFLLTKFVLKRKKTPELDSLIKDSCFQNQVNKVMLSYEDKWPIVDISVNKYEPVDTSTPTIYATLLYILKDKSVEIITLSKRLMLQQPFKDYFMMSKKAANKRKKSPKTDTNNDNMQNDEAV